MRKILYYIHETKTRRNRRKHLPPLPGVHRGGQTEPFGAKVCSEGASGAGRGIIKEEFLCTEQF